MKKIAINGFGRIGRLVFKIGLEKGLDIVAINDLTPIETLVHLLKYDSVYGRYKEKVEAGKDFIKIKNRKIQVFAEPDPEKLPWKKLGVDYVIESTGLFKTKEKAMKHIKAGAKRVLISAPSDDAEITIVYGVNHNKLKDQKIISVASCTTNCLAPLAKVLEENFGINKAFMTTVHAYTSSQNVVDGPNKHLRRARTAGLNIVPTTSGATTATAKVIPQLEGKMDGLSMRVPVACGSIVDFVAELKKPASKDKINEAFKKASKNELKGVLDYTEDEIVSSDIIGDPHSSIIDGKSTQVLGNLVKVLSWYDNEYGYSNRMIDVLKLIK
ncbi:MAG: type I glyceraldehyde-3-phosphate dehydrogenase [Nanoarchaeota archaeon]